MAKKRKKRIKKEYIEGSMSIFEFMAQCRPPWAYVVKPSDMHHNEKDQ